MSILRWVAPVLLLYIWFRLINQILRSVLTYPCKHIFCRLFRLLCGWISVAFQVIIEILIMTDQCWVLFNQPKDLERHHGDDLKSDAFFIQTLFITVIFVRIFCRCRNGSPRRREMVIFGPLVRLLTCDAAPSLTVPPAEDKYSIYTEGCGILRPWERGWNTFFPSAQC
jgi:hypothetical protein